MTVFFIRGTGTKNDGHFKQTTHNSKYIIDLNVKHKTVQFLEKTLETIFVALVLLEIKHQKHGP